MKLYIPLDDLKDESIDDVDVCVRCNCVAVYLAEGESVHMECPECGDDSLHGDLVTRKYRSFMIDNDIFKNN